MEGSQTYISDDMLIEILSRLPVKSLMQLRCVCRSWYQIISTTTFINAQRKTISNTNTGYLLCTHLHFFSLICKEELTNYHRKYYCKPGLFESSQICHSDRIKVHGSCNGLTCVSHSPLNINNNLYLLNPVIRKCKKIPKIPIEVDVCRGYPDLCFGYFNDDYKVVMITHFLSTYRVGVYSLTTDCWKITDCGSTDGTNNSFGTHLSSVCVNGVAYFVKHGGRIVSFDLHKERTREVEFPELIKLTYWNSHYLLSMEAYGGSIVLLRIGDGHLIKWILRNCGVTNTHTWEMKLIFSFNLGTPPRPIHRVGFTNDNTYVLRNDFSSSYVYLCDIDRYRIIRKVHVKDLTCEEEAKEKDLLEMYPLVENLVLLNEENLDPFVEIIQVLEMEQIVQAKEDKKENTRDTKKKEVTRSRSRSSSIFKLFKVFNCFNRK